MRLPRSVAPAVLMLAACGSFIPSQQTERLGPDDVSWHPSGSLSVPRASPDVVTLPDGRVLVLGGLESVPTPVEAYDPSTGKWKTWGDALQRTEAPVVLADGRVLVTNERAPKLLDPVTHDITSAGAFVDARTGHTATLLHDGRVLVTGGTIAEQPTARCEIYDPASNTWSGVASMSHARQNHAAALLKDGRVLVASGEGSDGAGGLVLTQSVEVYDPAANAWSPLAETKLPHADAFAAQLLDDTVLILGGQSDSALFSAERYTVGTDTWADVVAPAAALDADDACLLKDGRVLIVAGQASYRFEDATSQWTQLGSVAQSDRTESAVAALNDDGALLVGGLHPLELPDLRVHLPDGGVSSGEPTSGGTSSGGGTSTSHSSGGGSHHVSHHHGHHHHHHH